MRTAIAMLAVLALGAGPAAAQGYGTFSPNGHPPAGTSKPANPYGVKPYGQPDTPAAPHRTQPYANPVSPPQPKPYNPKPAKPCETSVFVDACKH